MQHPKSRKQLERTDRRGTYSTGADRAASHSSSCQQQLPLTSLGVANHGQHLECHTWKTLNNFPALIDLESNVSADTIALERT